MFSLRYSSIGKMISFEAPLLSTPASHILDEQANPSAWERTSLLQDHEIYARYEVDRTLKDIRKAKYKRVALQFPDSMLPDAPRVFDMLTKSLNSESPKPSVQNSSIQGSDQAAANLGESRIASEETFAVRFYILADTSYGACCVDEIAAEHVDAEVVVHYGRACLSPTSRIPVIHVFTVQLLAHQDLIDDFLSGYTDVNQKILLMADVTYQSHLPMISKALENRGYSNLFTTAIIHDPSSPLPNRTVPDEVMVAPSMLKQWHLFHISDPPESLPLILASRVATIRIFPTANSGSDSDGSFLALTSRTLNRRYALLTSITTVSTIGILINTLSVKNYLHIVDHIKSEILQAGKKSYTFVVGKVNAAKVANFSEIGVWVVIGCWESSLIDSKDFWKPVLTPFELGLALQGDQERVWTGEWSSDFQRLLDKPVQALHQNATAETKEPARSDMDKEVDSDSESESAPPEFDLRIGRYVSHTRPMQKSMTALNGKLADEQSLIKRVKGELAVVGGEVSPGAEHLRSSKSWKGLGSDYEIAYEENGAAVEEGRKGIARGYTHSESKARS